MHLLLRRGPELEPGWLLLAVEVLLLLLLPLLLLLLLPPLLRLPLPLYLLYPLPDFVNLFNVEGVDVVSQVGVPFDAVAVGVGELAGEGGPGGSNLIS